MAEDIGPEGQVVIEKEIREQFGIQPGWRALQLPAADHVKIYFLPPPHRRSLKGCLAQYAQRTLSDEDWDRARASAWDEAARGEFGAVGDA